MKKGLMGFVLVIVLGGLSAYYYVGMRAENLVKANVADLNQVVAYQMQPGQKVSFTVENYQRGFFSSTADLRMALEVNLPQTANRAAMRIPNMSYPLKLEIKHGPFVFSKGYFGMAYVTAGATVPEKMKSLAKMMLEDRSTLPYLEIALAVNFDKSSKVKINIPSFQLFPRTKKGEIVWQGFEAVYNISDKGKKIDGETVMKGLSFVSDKINANIEQIKMAYDVHLSPFNVWLGTASFNFPSMDISEQGAKLFQLTGLSMNSSADIKSQLLDMGFDMQLGKVVVNGTDYGPGSFEMLFNSLDASVFSKVQVQVQAINGGSYTAEQKQQMLAKLIPEFSGLLAKGAQLELKKFSLLLPQGKVGGNMKVSVPKGVQVSTPVELAKKLTLKADFQVPTVLVKAAIKNKATSKLQRSQMLLRKQAKLMAANSGGADSELNRAQAAETNAKLMSPQQIAELAEKRADMQLQKLVKHRVLIEEGALYKINIVFDQGQLKVNGQDVSPEMFKQ